MSDPVSIDDMPPSLAGANGTFTSQGSNADSATYTGEVWKHETADFFYTRTTSGDITTEHVHDADPAAGAGTAVFQRVMGEASWSGYRTILVSGAPSAVGADGLYQIMPEAATFVYQIGAAFSGGSRDLWLVQDGEKITIYDARPDLVAGDKSAITVASRENPNAAWVDAGRHVSLGYTPDGTEVNLAGLDDAQITIHHMRERNPTYHLTKTSFIALLVQVATHLPIPPHARNHR